MTGHGPGTTVRTAATITMVVTLLIAAAAIGALCAGRSAQTAVERLASGEQAVAMDEHGSLIFADKFREPAPRCEAGGR